jgi:hypothetical protein
MISHTFENKDYYEGLMSSYLSGQASAEQTVRSFFKKRHADVDIEVLRTGIECDPAAEAWEAVFADLFNACDDLDLFPDIEGGPDDHWIDEPTFRSLITEILPRFQAFAIEPEIERSVLLLQVSDALLYGLPEHEQEFLRSLVGTVVAVSEIFDDELEITAVDDVDGMIHFLRVPLASVRDS